MAVEVPKDPGERWGRLLATVDNIETKLDIINGRCEKRLITIQDNHDAITELKSWRKITGTLLAGAWAGVLTLGGLFIKRG